MRTFALIGIVLVWIVAYCRPAASDDSIKLPMTPVLVEPDNTPVPSSEVISTLAADQWYVIESAIELIALQSPEGIVDIESTAGQIKVRGQFVDGSGKIETRTYSSPFVYFVTAKTAGKTELILIPVVLTWCMGGEQATAEEMHAHVVDDYNRNRDRQRRRVARKIRKQNGDVSREQSYMMADGMIKKAIATPSDEAAMYAASFE